MFHSFSARYLCLVLLLGSWISLALCDDDDSEEEADRAPPEPIPEDDEPDPKVQHVDSNNGSLTLEVCRSPDSTIKEKCCKNGLEIDDAFIKCFILFQKKIPKENEQNPTVLIKFLSCLIECVYKSKKFIGKGDSLNMKMVKSAAKKEHKDDSNRRDYMIASYEHCERHAASEWGTLKKNPAARILFSGACKPYFMFVFICITEYGKISCPHFVWKGKKETAEDCSEMKSKCEEMQP